MKTRMLSVICFALALVSTVGLHAQETIQVAALSDFYDKIRESKDGLKDAALDKARQALDELHACDAEIREAGFEISKVHLEIGLCPSATVLFINKRAIGKEKEAAILERNKDKELLSWVLKYLFKVRAIEFANYRTEAASISLSIPPKTTLILSPKD